MVDTPSFPTKFSQTKDIEWWIVNLADEAKKRGIEGIEELSKTIDKAKENAANAIRPNAAQIEKNQVRLHILETAYTKTVAPKTAGD